MPSSVDLPKPGLKPRSPMLQENFLLSKSQGKSMNTGVGSLSLPQGVFLSQKSNQVFLHCKQILYQLGYQGSLLYSLDLTYLTKDHLSGSTGLYLEIFYTILS